jgi:hypothetical protein
MDSRIPRKKTHNIAFEIRRLHYQWHPWYGLDILTRRAGGANAATAYFCKLPEMGPDATLVEIPQWMFDPAQCAIMRVNTRPEVNCAALRDLKKTIADLFPSANAIDVTTVAVPVNGPRRGDK